MNNESRATAWLVRLLPWGVCAALLIVIIRQGVAPIPPSDQSPKIAAEKKVGLLHRTRNSAITEEEWKEAKKFFLQHSPVREKRIEELERVPVTASSPKHFEGLKRVLVDAWLDLSILKEESPEIYDTRVKEVEIDDKIFGLCLEMKHNKADKPRLQSQLKVEITDLFKQGFIERKQRIARVETAIGDQKTQLDNDVKDQARLIDARYHKVLQHGVDGAHFEHGAVKSKSGSTTSESPGEMP